MKSITYRMIYLMIFLFTAACEGSYSISSPDVAKPASWPSQAWQISTPEQQGMDSSKLADMFDAIQTQQINLHSLLIARNGSLVVETYYPPYTYNVRHTIESNTKSIIGTLIGIAIDQGKIKSVDQKLLDFFPNRYVYNLDDKKKAISLKDLLSMQPGLDCADQTPAANDMYQTRGWIQYLLDLPMTTRPGKQWIYCSGAAHLLSAVLQQATGMDARTYANQFLFQPLGIPSVEEMDWGTDPQQVTNGIAGLYLTPRELAKYGLLYLNRGEWDGKQIVSAQWVDESTREQAYIGKDEYVEGLDRRFGYMFSLFPDQKYYGYLGMAGQELFVLPKENMVVVFTASLGLGKEGKLLTLINDYILPSIKSDHSLPENSQSNARLQRMIQAVSPEKQPVQPLPQIAVNISGKTYRLDENSLGWSTIAFSFEPDGDEAILKMEGTPDLKIGLDGTYRLTAIPNGRPIGLKATWKNAEELYLEYITLGEFVESTANIKFRGDEITISLNNVNFDGPPQVIHGNNQK